MENFSHIVEIDEDRKTLTIYRLHEDGKKVLLTSTELPDRTLLKENKKAIREFAEMLGENILLDSPIARKLLDL